MINNEPLEKAIARAAEEEHLAYNHWLHTVTKVGQTVLPHAEEVMAYDAWAQSSAALDELHKKVLTN